MRPRLKKINKTRPSPAIIPSSIDVAMAVTTQKLPNHYQEGQASSLADGGGGRHLTNNSLCLFKKPSNHVEGSLGWGGGSQRGWKSGDQGFTIKLV